MAYPPQYVRAYSFTDFEVNFPGVPKPGPQLDIEYDAVSNALTATQTALALIQRADGQLANGIVGEDQLDPTLFDGIADDAVADAEAAAAAAAGSAAAAAGSASAASSSATAASSSAGVASGAAAQAGVSQGIAQTAAVDAGAAADDAEDAADVAIQAANDTSGSVAATEAAVQRAFEWAELLTGPVLPAPPGWPEAVDDGMFSSKWWAIRAREYNAVETIDLGTAGTDIGNAFDIWDAVPGNDLGPGLTYATWGDPVQTYVLTDRSDPSDPASWTNITGGPGPAGPPNTLTIGTVTTGAVGSPAAATITGVSPDQVLNLTLPTGATGATGGIGPAGPPNALAVGTVTTGAPGSSAIVGITGTAPTQTINFTIPRGDTGAQGIQGIQGIQGPVGPAVNLANVTGTIGLTAVNGVATTAPRSDSSPALSQAIAPTWSATHTFSQPVSGIGQASTIYASALPGVIFTNTAGATDSKHWVEYATTSARRFTAYNDAATIEREWMRATRSGVAINNVSFGNVTDNPAFNFLGTGLTTKGGSLQVNGDHIALHNTDTYFEMRDTDAGTDEKVYWLRNSNGAFSLQTRADSLAAGMNALTFTRTGTAVTQMLVGPDGTVALPGISFWNDNNTGFYRAGTDTMVAVLGGAQSMIFSPSLVYVNQTTVFQTGDGTVATPGLGFSGDPDTGIYRRAANDMAFAIGGVLGAVFSATQNTFPLAPIYAIDGTAALPAFSFNSDIDTGMYRNAANSDARLVYGGVESFYWSATYSGSLLPFLFGDGGAGTPSITFRLDTDTGFYRWGSDAFAATSGGTAVMSWRLGQSRINDGTVGAPALCFENDTDTGLYRTAADTMGFSAAGALRLRFAGSAQPLSLVGGGVQGTCYIGYFRADTTTRKCYLGYGDSNSDIFYVMNEEAAGDVRIGTLGVARLTIAAAGTASFSSTCSAVSFTSTSSRAIKRETGSPRKPANILARLRPLLYRLLDGDDHEQLGLIAEEVHEVCPQLSDGKTVAYDRLAILLLAAWQDEHAEAA